MSKIEVIVDITGQSFKERVNELLKDGYILSGAVVACNERDKIYPFLYTAILIWKN